MFERVYWIGIVFLAMFFFVVCFDFGHRVEADDAYLRKLHAELERVLEDQKQCRRDVGRWAVPYPISLCSGWDKFQRSCQSEAVTVGLMCEPMPGNSDAEDVRKAVCRGHIKKQYQAWKKWIAGD